MKTGIAYKQELVDVIDNLPKESAKELVEFAKYLQWQSIAKKTFAERVDDLWTKMRTQAEKSKYGPKDVVKLISKTRKGK